MRDTCPFCGSTNIDCEYVDIGVGFQQVTPYFCSDCLAHQMNPPYDDYPDVTAEERATGWVRGLSAEEIGLPIDGLEQPGLTNTQIGKPQPDAVAMPQATVLGCPK